MYQRILMRDYKGLWRAQVALPVWPAHQPRRYPGETSVRGPIVVRYNRRRESTEFEIKGTMEERTERESGSRRREMTDLLMLPRPAKNGAGFSGET